MPIDLNGLNENQRTAVSWNSGPLLVLAGPGSGKTRVLTFRVARLLEEREDVAALALTFTNKATVEMRERVDALLGERTSRARLHTFHSFAAAILRQHGSHLGLRPDFSLITQDQDQIAILDEVIAGLPDYETPLPTDRKNLLSLIERLFAESYDGCGDAPSLIHTPDWLPHLFVSYCDTLLASNRLDFGSLLHFARQLLEEKPGVARVVRIGWTHVCVDEFQDTNKAQYDLLRLIAPDKRHNLFVVGDDDQIIYQWNGASPERLAHLQRDYEIDVVQLPECYRCPAPIIALANRLIAHNRMRTPGKTPITPRSTANLNGNPVRYGAFASPEKEAAFIPMDIHARSLRGEECVVLGRSVKLIERAADALRDAGYEAYLARQKSDFESASVCVMVEALRLANGRHDRDILRRLCLAWKKLSGQTLEVDDVVADAVLVGGDFLRAWADAASTDTTGCAALTRIRSDLVDSLAFLEIINWFLHQGWQLWSEKDDRDVADEVTTWQNLHDEIVREYNHGNLTLNAYLQQMDLTSKTPRPGPNAVRCMTMHGAKGLEFKHVYLIGMAQEVLPSYYALQKGETSQEVEEERRNCFVAITRVEETLTLTRSTQYYGYPKAPSQFLTEMGIGGNK